MPIDINMLRTEKGGCPDVVRKSEEARGRSNSTVDSCIGYDVLWRKTQFEYENLRKDISTVQKIITQKKRINKLDPCIEENEEKSKLTDRMKEKEIEAEDVCSLRTTHLNKIGNVILEGVPVYRTEEDNRVIRTNGNIPNIKCDGKTKGSLFHHQLMNMIGAFDQVRGTKIFGHRGYFLTGVGVLLNQALINYGLSFLIRKGYTPMQPPLFMKKSVMSETAELADFDDQLYKVEGSKKQSPVINDALKNLNILDKEITSDDFYLIATSEQPISAFHKGEWILDSTLPLKYAGISTCFRKEAGHSGKDAWGLFRVHQFEKIEQFCITKPTKYIDEDGKEKYVSEKMHKQMLEISEEFYQTLGLPYRVVEIVSAALNDAAAMKYDLEAWFPGYGTYRELVSCSNCTDYQSRALQIRTGTHGSKEGVDWTQKYVHMLNSTLCATERTMCCIVENYQAEDGVLVPEVLKPYMCGIELMSYVKSVADVSVD